MADSEGPPKSDSKDSTVKTLNRWKHILIHAFALVSLAFAIATVLIVDVVAAYRIYKAEMNEQPPTRSRTIAPYFDQSGNFGPNSNGCRSAGTPVSGSVQ